MVFLGNFSKLLCAWALLWCKSEFSFKSYFNKCTALYTITLLNVLPSILLCIFFTYCIALYTVTALILPNSCNSSNSWSLEIIGLEKYIQQLGKIRHWRPTCLTKLAISFLIYMLQMFWNNVQIARIKRYLLCFDPDP